jgi:membrane-associated phospholipid phosphatase
MTRFACRSAQPACATLFMSGGRTFLLCFMSRSTLTEPKAHWLAESRRRLRALWRVKMIGTTAGMGAFFTGYFWLLNHPVFPVTVMPRTPLDALVPFQPGALAIYASLWLYVSLAIAWLRDERELRSHGIAAAAVSVAGLAIFLCWPTAVPRVAGEATGPAFGFALLHEIDASGNACPSLHVAFAVLAGAWLDRILREMGAGKRWRAGNGVWAAAIVYSTLATRQHVVLDVVAGAGLGLAVAFAHAWWTRRFPR